MCCNKQLPHRVNSLIFLNVCLQAALGLSISMRFFLLLIRYRQLEKLLAASLRLEVTRTVLTDRHQVRGYAAVAVVAGIAVVVHKPAAAGRCAGLPLVLGTAVVAAALASAGYIVAVLAVALVAADTEALHNPAAGLRRHYDYLAFAFHYQQFQ